MTPLAKKVCLVVLLLGMVTGTAHAGGIILYEISSPDVGLAAAGYAARAQDASTVFTNPAGLTRLEGSQFEGGLQALYVNSKFKSDADTGPQAGGDGGNAGGWIPAGGLFMSHELSDDWALGMGVFSYFGLGLDYDDDWAGRYFVQEAELIGLTLMPSVAYRVNDQLSLGLGLNIMHGQFMTQAAVNNTPFGVGAYDDGQLKIDSNEWGLGANLGIMYELNKGTRFGLTYLSKVELDFSDTPEFTNIRPALEAVLRLMDLWETNLDLEMRVPQTLMLSTYHELSDTWALMGNIGWQEWSDFGKMNVTINSTEPTSLTADRKYEDTWHLAVGGQYKLSQEWLLSAGLAYDSSMVKDEGRTPDMAVGESYRLGMGGQYQVKENMKLGLGYTYLWGGDLSMDHSSRLGGRLSGEYESVQIHVVTGNLAWVF